MMFDARQRNDIPTWTTETRPTAIRGNIIGYNTTTSKLEFYNGAAWVDLH
jgi:hypothetical protein